MKTKLCIILFFFLAILGNLSCREPIDINIPETQKKIVLNGFINPDSTIKINLSESLSILERDKDLKFLKTAVVKIYEDETYKETLQYDTNGYYIGTIYPQIGKEYKVTAEYPPLDNVDAETVLLKPPVITEINSEPQFYSNVQTWYNSVTGEPFDTTIYELEQLNVNLILQDPPNEDNYYFLTFSAIIPQYDYPPPDGNPVFTGEKMTYLDYNASNLNWENNFYTRDLKGFVFSDNLFNGKNFTLNTTVYVNTESAPNKVYVGLHSVTEDFYQYVISYSKYQDIEGNPFAEPVNIKTNIHHGFGFFSGYSTKKDSIIIDYSNVN
ncbi:MAG: DUF4249 domain-containing protein [Chlorobi bacterium]|nr:DUF4249 domain-containing protein [Chlorobiota bacterium]